MEEALHSTTETERKRRLFESVLHEDYQHEEVIYALLLLHHVSSISFYMFLFPSIFNGQVRNWFKLEVNQSHQDVAVLLWQSEENTENKRSNISVTLQLVWPYTTTEQRS